MMRSLRRGGFHYPFLARSKRWFAISGIVVLVSIGSLVFKGFNLGLEFKGGTAFQVEAKRDVEVKDFRDALAAANVTDAVIQQLRGPDSTGFLIQTEHLEPQLAQHVSEQVAKTAGVEAEDVNITDVGPKWGQQITAKAVRALVIFLVIVALYISVRFEPKMAGAALVALFHDLTVTAGIYALIGFVVTPSTVIAILTILGYSLYDTVIIFDRVKERTAGLSAAGRYTYSDVANESLNQVLVRSLNTSLTSLIPVGSLLFVGSFLLGAETLRELALALFIGIGVGTYSSIFVAVPILAAWKERESRWATLRQRIAARQATAETPARPAARTHEPEVVEAAAGPSVSRAGQRPPQRRKKRKRRR